MVFRIQDNRHRYEIRARRAGLHPKDFRPELHEITAIHWWNDERGKQRKREYRADQCSIKIRRGLGEAPEMVYVSLTGNVTFTDSQYPDQSRPEPGKHVDLDPVVLPAHVVDPAENRLGDLELLGLRPEDLEEPDYGAVLDRELEPLSLGAPLERARDAALKEFIKLHQEIAGIIHSRLAFSVSVLVTLVLAAALGIIFRGGQLLTAFVISFIPGLLVVVMNIMGRQLSENTGTHLLGIIVIWAGIGLLALADGVVLTRYLRR